MKNSPNKGFTLIELLIVIAIIGILAAVLVPNVLNARKRALDTSAQTYAKDIVEALAMAYGDPTNINCRDLPNSCFHIDDRADCLSSSWLIDQGLPSEYPRGVRNCNLEYEDVRGYTIVTVESVNGTIFTLNF